MNVCDNLGDHLVGNVYVKFRKEEDAEKAVIDLNNRWFNGQPIHAELSPVTDFREACCRQYEIGECTRGGFCNFMHLKPISRELRRELYGRRRKRYKLCMSEEGDMCSSDHRTVFHFGSVHFERSLAQ
uniref:U2 small nuclear RNA auxiliary factor 1 n=1 Tax=Haplochromis burtoni TaxID=8153 RepID=A0A3Q2VY41_HAPBU